MLTTIIILISILLAYLLLRIGTVLWLIFIYNKAIKELPSDYDEARIYLDKRMLKMGLCSISHSIIYTWATLWIDRYNPGVYGTYWYIIPSHCNTSEQIGDTLVFRRNRLKYVLKRLTIFN